MHALIALDYDLIHDIAYDTQNTTAVTLSGYLCSGASHTSTGSRLLSVGEEDVSV